MCRRLALWLLPLVVASALAGCSDSGDKAEPPEDRANAIAAKIDAGDLSLDGEDLYNKTCAMCHGPQGQGGIGKPLAGVVAEKYTVVEHVTIVLNGQAAMPKFSSSLDDDEIAAIVNYERTDLGQ